jgi:Tfp pilus assembly protein PilN
MATINLAPDTEFRRAAEKRQRLILFMSAIIVLVVIVSGGGIWLFKVYTERTLARASTNLRAVETEIARLDESAQRVILFEERLKAMDALLNQHVTWDPIVREVERLLPAPAVLQTATFNGRDGMIQITGRTPDLDTVAQTLASLSSQPARTTLFSSAVLRSTKREEQRPEGQTVATVYYTFIADLRFNPTVLRSAR